ncbi:hypothetical protein [Halomonas sp.]|uniref:DUF4376 domain-containing protein n=1 Tax=Halomonas sp. TaxID=1486246 RepID=UPI003D0A97A7
MATILKSSPAGIETITVDDEEWAAQNQQPLDVLYDSKHQSINAERDRRLYPGPLPTSIATVDLRSARDESNLAHLRAVARERQTANDITPIHFRNADNVTQMLAPAQVITMTDEVLGYGQQIYATSWKLKDQLQAIYDDEQLTPAEKRTQLEAVVWPE